jgi:hypothetical protein
MVAGVADRTEFQVHILVLVVPVALQETVLFLRYKVPLTQ